MPNFARMPIQRDYIFNEGRYSVVKNRPKASVISSDKNNADVNWDTFANAIVCPILGWRKTMRSKPLYAAYSKLPLRGNRHLSMCVSATHALATAMRVHLGPISRDSRGDIRWLL